MRPEWRSRARPSRRGGGQRILRPAAVRGAQPEAGPPELGAAREKPRAAPGEACEMCAEPLGDGHSHVVNLDSRQILCTCRACYLLFTHQGAAGGRYAVPDRYLRDLGVPARRRRLGRPADPGAGRLLLPQLRPGPVAGLSPAGATESLLPLEAWADLAAANPAMTDLEPDVEALLVQRAGGGFECFLVLIDACYELVGLVRMHWKGFDGGQEAGRRSTASSTPSGSGAGRSRTGRGPGNCDRRPGLRLHRRPASTATRPSPPSSSSCGSRRRPASRSTPSRCAARSASSPSAAATRRRRPTGLELFGEPPRWGDTLKPMQFATVSLMVPSFTGSIESTCRCPAPTTSRWPPPSTCTPSATARCRCCCCSAGRCSPRG